MKRVGIFENIPYFWLYSKHATFDVKHVTAYVIHDVKHATAYAIHATYNVNVKYATNHVKPVT